MIEKRGLTKFAAQLGLGFWAAAIHTSLCGFRVTCLVYSAGTSVDVLE